MSDFTEFDPLECAVYVACSAAYNEGHLHGVWVDLCADEDDQDAAVEKMLGSSPAAYAEETRVDDVDGMPALGAYAGLQAYRDMYEKLCEIEEHHGEAGVLAIWDALCKEEIEGLENIEDLQIWVESDAGELCEAVGALEEVPERLRYYIDEEALLRDLSTDYDRHGRLSDGDLYLINGI